MRGKGGKKRKLHEALDKEKQLIVLFLYESAGLFKIAMELQPL